MQKSVGQGFCLASHQLSSRQIDRRQQEDRVQPRVGLHLPSLLLHLHVKLKKITTRQKTCPKTPKASHWFILQTIIDYLGDSANNNIPNLTVEPEFLNKKQGLHCEYKIGFVVLILRLTVCVLLLLGRSSTLLLEFEFLPGL